MRTHVESLGKPRDVNKALPGKLDIKRHSPSIVYISASLAISTSVLEAMPGKLDIKRHAPCILYVYTELSGHNSRLSFPDNIDFFSDDRLYLSKRCSPVEMPHCGVFHLGLHCLTKYPFRGFWTTKGYLVTVSVLWLFLMVPWVGL